MPDNNVHQGEVEERMLEGILTLQGLYEKVMDGRIMVFVEGSKDL